MLKPKGSPFSLNIGTRLSPQLKDGSDCSRAKQVVVSDLVQLADDGRPVHLVRS
jgi:hypothetical protein